MNETWNELKSTRNFLLALSLFALTLLFALSLSGWLQFRSTMELQSKVHASQVSLQGVIVELEQFTLGSDAQSFRMGNLSNLSPLPRKESFQNALNALVDLQNSLDGVEQSNLAWKELRQKAETKAKDLQLTLDSLLGLPATDAEHEAISNVVVAAASIQDWLLAGELTRSGLGLESKVISTFVQDAENSLAQTPTVAMIRVRRAWDQWMGAVREELLEEKVWAMQLQRARTGIMAYSAALNQGLEERRNLVNSASRTFLALQVFLTLLLFALLSILLWNRKAQPILANSHSEALTAELHVLGSQVEEMLAHADKTYAESGLDLESVGNALADSRLAETRLTRLMAKLKNQGPDVLADLESLALSEHAIVHQLQQLRHSLKRLRLHTAKLRHDGESVELATQDVQSAID